jgi:hypothetical protein
MPFQEALNTELVIPRDGDGHEQALEGQGRIADWHC